MLWLYPHSTEPIPQAFSKYPFYSAIAVLILSLLILGAYAGVFKNRLVARDTEKFITHNPHVQELSAENL